ncbi:hypothetical protein [Pseudogracilibacillus auburnensis]|uniref:hypothetical protein n=1 Tax=Pseudogracilibacillus auburnensis TaxID=1494959 RepID=UPI001A95D369|nr:hypothetical protein [Pseudogracilibacillus auburnensis]MBO1006017.1 hypothetical protein [Pseudogracilibacillus auburnensis]
MDCLRCNKDMLSVESEGVEGKFLLLDLGNKDEFGNYPTKDGLVVDAFLCSSCGEYKFRAPKQ